jgi:signal transduction histidine kinase
VLDTGIGIAPADQRLIFEELRQLANPERSAAKGLGLGLSIVQRLSRLLDHPIAIDSELGKGSRFAISVPVGASVLGHMSNDSSSPDYWAIRPQ